MEHFKGASNGNVAQRRMTDGSAKSPYSTHREGIRDVSNERNYERNEQFSERYQGVRCDHSATKRTQNLDEYPVVIWPGVEDRTYDRMGKAYSLCRRIISYSLITWLSCAVPQCHIT